MATAWWAGGLALVMHAALYVAMSRIPKNIAHESTVVTMASQKKAKKDEQKKEADKPPEPPKPIKAPPRLLARPTAVEPPPPAQNTPPPPVNTPAAHAALAAMPDFGLSLSGGSGPGGIAVPMGGSDPNAIAGPAKAAAPAEHAIAAQKPAQADECTEALVKSKPLGAVQPQYTDEARTAGVEGRVRLSLTIDASGAVTAASVLSGLGHGLDQSAISAAKRMKFSPATRCGKATESTFIVTLRFVLGD